MNGKTPRSFHPGLCRGAAALGRFGAVLFALVAFAGCSAPKASLFPPEPPDLAFLAERAAGRAYEIIGVIQVDGNNFSTERLLKARLQEKARELGADDVMNVRVMSLSRGNGFFRLQMLTAEGIAVRWLSPSPVGNFKPVEETADLAP